MAWIVADAISSSLNQRFSTASAGIFKLKQLLKNAGWTVQMSSDGTNYNAAGDQIAIPGSGLTGMNNNYAWFRIQDPSARREYIFQRYTSDANWIVVYSALDKFTGGAPNATTRSTATDEKGVLNGITAIASATNLFPTAPWTFNAAAQSKPQNGVYPFWMIASNCVGTTATVPTVIACETVRTKDSQDADPCIHIAGDAVTDQTLTGAAVNDGFNGWQLMNLSGEEWGPQGLNISYWNTSYIGSNSTNEPAVNPYNNQQLLFAPSCNRQSLSQRGQKGVLWNLRWNSLQQSARFGHLMFDGRVYYICTDHLAFPGWPSPTLIPIV